MARGFFSGLIWGAVVSLLVVVALSLLIRPDAQVAQTPSPTEVAVPAGSEFNRNRPDARPVIPQPETLAPRDATPAVTAAAPEAAPTADTEPAAAPRPEVTAPGDLASPQAGTDATPQVTASLSAPQTSTQAPAAPSFGATAPVSAAPPAPVAPLPTPGRTVPTPDTPQVLQLEPRATTSRLPTIGGSDAPEDGADPDPEVEAEEEAASTADETAETATASLGALARNAAPFTGDTERPLFSVVLIDVGDAGLERETLTTFSFPVTFAIDPTMPGAAEAAAAYRRAGHEVLILATGIPEGAQPSDIEVTLTSYIDALPQAMGVVDVASDGFQTQRDLMNQVVDILNETGHGLLTYDRGLNTALQVAEREGVPASLIFRELDASQESADTIRRYLDRAAFKASQDGSVVMIGRSYPDTVTALFTWALEARSQTVRMAPLSAVMRAN